MTGRFDLATRRLKHWSTVPFTAAAASNEYDATFPDGTTLPDQWARVRQDVSGGLEIDPTLPPLLDVTGFVQALKAQLGGIVTLAAIVQKYPGAMLFLRAIEAGEWSDARAILDDALAKGAVGQAAHDGILTLAAQHGIAL